jgi:hypothetical protein
MKILAIIFLLCLIIACKNKNDEIKSENVLSKKNVEDSLIILEENDMKAIESEIDSLKIQIDKL